MIVGEEKPYDFLIQLTEINQVSEAWVDGLNKAINGNDLLICKTYLADKLALSWSNEINNNLQRIEKNIENQLRVDRISKITTQIKVENERIYDPDFENEIMVTFQNNNPEDLTVKYKIHNQNYTCKLKGKEEQALKLQIKNIKRQDLKVTIIDVH